MSEKANLVSTGKRLFFSAVLVVILFLGLLVLEILMIVLDPVIGTGFFQFDRDLGFRVRAHSSGTNQFGFNDREYSLEKPDDRYRILTVSDSFGWAGGRDGNYTEILERLLAERYGENRVEVINSGYPMTHTGEQLGMLRKFGLQYAPDLVILGFFVGNDFIDSRRFRKWIVVNDAYFDIDARNERIFLGYPIVPQSRLVHLIRQRTKLVAEYFRSGGTAMAGLDPAGVDGTFSRKAFRRIETTRMQFSHVRKQEKGAFDDRIAFVEENLTAMTKLLRSRNIDFIVALFPDEYQVNPRLRQQLSSEFGMRESDYDLELPQRLIWNHMKAHHVPVIDLLQPFAERGLVEDLYLLRNTHWNDAGRRLAAEVIFDGLTERLDRVDGLVTAEAS
jgi:hypothetical protein